MPDVRSAVRAELARITDRYEAADRRVYAAAGVADRQAAEAERDEARAEFWAAGEDLADLCLLLLRYALRHRPAQLLPLLSEGLRGDAEAERLSSRELSRLSRGWAEQAARHEGERIEHRLLYCQEERLRTMARQEALQALAEAEQEGGHAQT